MKIKNSLIFVIFFLFSLSALALDSSSSWEKITSSRHYDPTFELVNFDGTYVSMANVCLEDDQLRTLNEVSYCIDGRPARGRSNPAPGCDEYEWGYLYTSPTYSYRVCERRQTDRPHGCARYSDPVELAYDLGPKMIKVFHVRRLPGRRGGRIIRNYAFSKEFQVPNCQ